MVLVGPLFPLCFLDFDWPNGQSKWKNCWMHDQGRGRRSSFLFHTPGRLGNIPTPVATNWNGSLIMCHCLQQLLLQTFGCFFDYVSLFQFKREKEAEEQSFRRSMGNMHAMYAHESTITFRLESLTPKERWQKAVKDGSQVTIFHFHDTGGLVEPVPLHALTSNANAYLDRGWCRAELSWSSVRGDTAQNQQIDVGSELIDTDLTGRTPVAPDVFAAEMHSAAFTHRSDADAVIELQKKVFLEKVTRRRKLKLEGVSLDQMQALTESLRHFKQLKSITVIDCRCGDFRCGENESNAFVEARFLFPTSRGESMWVCSTHYLVVICVTCLAWVGVIWKALKSCLDCEWQLLWGPKSWYMKSCENNTKHDIIKLCWTLSNRWNSDTKSSWSLCIHANFLQPIWPAVSRFQPQWRCKHVALRRRIRHLCMSVLYLSVLSASSTARGGWRKFQEEESYRRDWLLWVTDVKAKTLTNWPTS